jgi:nucleotide-binding universal stress UspA family protein
MNRIVIGLDGTDKDRALVRWVADFADEVDAHVIAAHLVAHTTLWMIAGAQADTGHYIEVLRHHLEHDVLPPLRERDPDLHLYVYVGDPAHELAHIARRSRADLIAIGARDHNALHDVVFGNIERRLVHLSDIPVLTVPHHAPRMHVVQ